MKVTSLTKEGWKPFHLWGSLALTAIAVLITYGAWSDMVYIALRDEECGHALLAIPAFVWLAWVRRGRLRRCRPNGKWVGTLMIALGWVLWSVGFRLPREFVWHAGALILTLGAFFSVVGSEVLWEFAAAFGVLVFIVPVPTAVREAIAIPMQGQTARVTQSICEMMGMAVERHQNLLVVHGLSVAITEACNGMRMVSTLIMVCYLFAFVSPLRGYMRAMLLILSPVVATICNVIRLVPTVWVYSRFSAETAKMFHDVSGWVMLVVALITMTGFVRLLRWAMVPVSHFRLVDV